MPNRKPLPTNLKKPTALCFAACLLATPSTFARGFAPQANTAMHQNVPKSSPVLDKLAQNPALRGLPGTVVDQSKYTGTGSSPTTTMPPPTGIAPSLGTSSDTQAKPIPSLNNPDKVTATIQYDETPVRPNVPGTSILQALDEALVKSPRAAAIRSQLQITRAAFADAASQPNPALFFDRGPYAEQVRRIGPAFNWEPPWKVVFRLLATKRLVDQTKTDLMTSLWSLRADVRRAYTEAVVAQETVETLTSLYDLASRLLQVSDKRFQAGDVPELDVLKARLATSQSDVERQVGQRRVIRARQQLNIIMGRKPEEVIEIPRLPAFLRDQNKAVLDETQRMQLLPDFSQEMAPLESYLAKGMDNRLELKSINQRLKLNQANTRTAYGNIIPNPTVAFGSSVSGNAPTGPKLNSVFVSLNIETPATNWNQGEIFRLKAIGKQLNYELESQKNQITQQISSAYNNVLAARQKLKVYQDHVLADSYEVARLARRSYEVGQSDITATLQVQQANINIRLQYLDAVRLYQEAFTDLEQACGRPLEY
ncbi:MAG: TolC family protein [Candidatus Obscuribacter sp.]|nr:TolC family protein [Candidatus Obscuribacter sp.]